MIIDCHGHYTTAPKGLQVWRDDQLAALKDPTSVPAKGTVHISDDEIRESLETGAAEAAARARHRRHDLLAARVGDGASHRRRDDEPALDPALQRPDSARLRALSGELRRRVPAAADAGRPARQLHRRARAVHRRARLHRLQSESGSVRRLLGRAAADRPVLVSVLREDGRARRAGDGPRQRVVQPELPRDRRALHQRRHDGVHAVPDRRSVQGLPGPARSSFRTAAAPCPTTGAAIAVWRRT